MYGHGHEHGTKQGSRSSQAWYDREADANIARIEAEDTERALVTALATQVGNAVTAMPEAASRIAKAATLVQSREVWPLTDGTWLVGSSSDTVKAYLVQRGPWVCDCADHTHRGVSYPSINAWAFRSPPVPPPP